MTFENMQGERFYLAADLLVDDPPKVHVSARKTTGKRPDWPWLDQHAEIPRSE